MTIKLEFPSEKREKDAMKFIAELIGDGSGTDGDSGLNKAENYGDWIQQKKDCHNDINVPKEHVPATAYFAIREEDDKIVGMVDLRHYLNDYLKESWNGHVGYSVRPTERRKGYATGMLKLALEECKGRGINSVVVGCDEDNIGSKKTILNCGGEFMDRSMQDGKMHLGFKIKLGENN